EGVGCFIVGSHVKKTTSQLNQLLDSNGTSGIELPIDRILDEPDELLNEVRDTILKLSDSGLTPVIFTARKEVRIDDADKRQQLGQIVSDFLVSIVEHLPYSPTYLVAKGGITSHDILTKGLHVKTATVMGQIVSSVPCIMTDKFPYIIFPGNVGNENSLKEVFEKLR
ncbi:MAG: nucleotide-binding domain containing protein, partial [Prevotella sp.]|nr:nucleotide-binding domain containing protein [Prevotella sp.]